MVDIFISYASQDRARAKILADSLTAKGWSVWWDRAIPPGKNFDQVIEEAIDAAKCIIVLWSRFSVVSNWVKAEAAEGLRRGVLVPALLDDEKIPLEFRRLQAARLVDWSGDTSHAEFCSLLKAVASIAGHPNTIQQQEAKRIRPPIVEKRLEEAVGRSGVLTKKVIPWFVGIALFVGLFTFWAVQEKRPSRIQPQIPPTAESEPTTYAEPAQSPPNAAERKESVQQTMPSDKLPPARSDSVSKILENRPRSWLGIVTQRITPELAISLGMDHPHGALVANLTTDGPAERAGVKVSDVIIAFDGNEIRDTADLPKLVAQTPVGRTVRLMVLRDSRQISLIVTLGEGGDLGLRVQTLTPEIADRFRLGLVQGVVITALQPGGAAERAGLRGGDAILEIERKRLRTLEEYRRAMEYTRDRAEIVFLVQRGEKSHVVVVKR